MAVVLALPRLFDAVAARFAAEGLDVPMSFGWLASAEQMRSDRRIVWIPGDEGGGLGAVTGARYPGGNPRALAGLDELCRVEITGSDPEHSERAQYQAASVLRMAWHRAVYLEARGTFKITGAKWVGGDRGRRMGATISITFTIQSPVPDTAVATAAVDTAAALDVAEHDLTEQLEVQPG